MKSLWSYFFWEGLPLLLGVFFFFVGLIVEPMNRYALSFIKSPGEMGNALGALSLGVLAAILAGLTLYGMRRFWPRRHADGSHSVGRIWTQILLLPVVLFLTLLVFVYISALPFDIALDIDWKDHHAQMYPDKS